MNRWFADLPELANQVDIADCEMVAGADTMIEILSNNKREITLVLVAEKPGITTDPKYIAAISKEDDNCDYGANYRVIIFESESNTNMIYSGSAWLCPVTKIMFEEYPDSIYIYKK